MNAHLAPSRRRARSYLSHSLRFSSEATKANRLFCPKAEAMAMLSEIVARLHGVDMPVVQFIRTSSESGVTEVAGSFAQASAICLGRTLLIRLWAPEAPCVSLGTDTASVATIPRRRTRKADTNSLDIVPDSTVAGLCHAQLGCDFGEACQMTHALPETWLDGVSLDFRLVVIESDAPERCPAALELATRCHGSVLVVTAGLTNLLRVRTVMRQVQLAGGTLLGLVLHDAPPAPRFRIPAWLNRLVGKPAG